MNCVICGHPSFDAWGRVGDYSILRCRECGMGVTSPFPEAGDIKKKNQEVYQANQRIQMYLSRREYFERIYRGYISRIKSHRRNAEGGELLDVGCNIGLFLQVARQGGLAVTGVELNEECAQYGRKAFGLEIFSDYLENIGFEDNKFDVVTLFDVLEHIPDMKRFIAEVRRILRPGGILVVQSPNIGSVMARLTRSKWEWLCPPDHLYHFTAETMMRFLRENGFAMQEVRTWESAEDFLNNIISTYRPGGIIGKLGVKFIRLIKVPLYCVRWVQSSWWRKLQGGLIELYAVKSES